MKSRTLSFLAVCAVVLSAIVLMGCTTPTSPVIVTTTVTNTQGGSTTTTPTDAPPASGPVVSVRVGLFGGACPDGSAIRGGATELKVGCTGYATATPLGAGNVKLPPEAHGPDCSWSVDRPDVVSLYAVENPFNRDIVALRAGTARVSATVKGVTGYFDVVVK
jgi:hypothetical protein